MKEFNFAVLREMSEEDEASGWVKSALAVKDGKKVVGMRLNKDKILKFYTYRTDVDKLTQEKLTAIKVKAEAKFKEEEARFERVNKKVIGLSHPNITKVTYVGTDTATNETIVVLEYAPGLSIYKTTEGMPVACMAPIFLQLIDAVVFMHQKKLLHLNLKPRRIRIKDDDDGFSFKLKLTDFGYAMDFGKFDEGYLPTPPFCAPEVAFQQKDKIGATSDLYSVGTIMYYCMARVLPFPDREEIETPRELVEVLKTETEPMLLSERRPEVLDMPYVGGFKYKVDSEKVKKLEEIVMGLIKKNVEDRPIKSALALAEAVLAIFPEAEANKFTSSATMTMSQK